MRLTSHRLLAPLLVLSAVSLGGGQEAHADELLVMPYSCRVVGGTPVLRPSPDQKGYPVIGRREQREFRACSPVNPHMCQRWTVHRFDLDCDGRRVPWFEVAAHAEAARGDGVFVSGGHLEIEMPPQWSLPAGGPCGRYREGDAERYGSFERFCEERLARTERLTVTLPRGFAPMFGIDGIFVEDEPHGVAGAERGPPGMPVEPPRRAEPIETAPREPKAAAAEPIPLPVPKPALKAAPPAPQSEPAKSEQAVAGGSSDPAMPVVPQIINAQNRPATAPAPTEGEAAVADTPPAPAPSPATDDAVAQSEVAAETAPMPETVAPADSVETGSLRDARRLPAMTDPAVIAAASFAVLSLITLAFLWRRRRAPSAPAISRDIAAVSFGKKAVAETPTLGRLPAVAAPAAAPPVEPPRPPTLPLPSGDEAMPRTRADALAVLGMDAGADVSEAAIKKVVDGLRASWHPDHARDADDRARREVRFKQINVAWGILSGPRTG